MLMPEADKINTAHNRLQPRLLISLIDDQMNGSGLHQGDILEGEMDVFLWCFYFYCLAGRDTMHSWVLHAHGHIQPTPTCTITSPEQVECPVGQVSGDREQDRRDIQSRFYQGRKLYRHPCSSPLRSTCRKRERVVFSNGREMKTHPLPNQDSLFFCEERLWYS